MARNTLSLLMTMSNIPTIIERAKRLDIITQGLDNFYSPNHVGQKTERHCDRQLAIADSLSLVASLVNNKNITRQAMDDLDTAALVLDWNYSKIAGMIENDAVKNNPAMITTAENLRNYFEPLLQGLVESDLKSLVAVVSLHDIGKTNIDWAQKHLDIEGIMFLAHDHDSRKIIEKNPCLLDAFELEEDGKNLVLDLIQKHSLPGQYFFGEGNLSGYDSILEYSRTIKSENPLKLARIHGLIDVISAINHGFVKPILNSHIKMSSIITETFNNGGTLAQAFEKEAIEATQNYSDIKSKYSLEPVSLHRLIRLTGINDSAMIDEALSEIDCSFIKEYDRVTKGTATWFGTYIANAFGTGLKRTYAEPSGENLKDVIASTIKMVAVASHYHRQFSDDSFMLSAVTPGLMMAGKQGEPIVKAIREIKNIKQSINELSPLYLKGDAHTVEISYKL